MADYQAIIDAIDAAMLTFASNPHATLTIDGLGSQTFSRPEELLTVRKHYQGLLTAQQTAAGTRVPIQFIGLRPGRGL